MTATVASRVRTGALSDSWLLATTLGGFVVYQIGAQVDTWYHAHYGFEIESFFTWAHALLYGGWVLSAAPAALRFARARTLPPGYPLVLAGAVAFGAGGAFDMAWHGAFGFEVGHEALVSPSHLVLIYASGLSCVGLVWAAAAWRARAGAGLFGDLALSFALGILSRNLLFALLYSEPLRTDYASGGAVAGRLFGFSGIAAWGDMAAQVAGTTGMALYAVILALVVVVPLRGLRLGGGSIAT
ncbi:MAG TPA: hypothetical protein VFM93_09145, partial [Candidatus Limnocylindria bacterium]|nr:hypothetical protein [Candidatus Limnocylindria bacterium]